MIELVNNIASAIKVSTSNLYGVHLYRQAVMVRISQVYR